MLLYRIDCDNCGAPRVGKKEGDEVEPLEEDCPICDSSNFVMLAMDGGGD